MNFLSCVTLANAFRLDLFRWAIVVVPAANMVLPDFRPHKPESSVRRTC